MFKPILFLFFLILINKALPQNQKDKNQGYLTLIMYEAEKGNPSSRQIVPYTQETRIWFKDSVAIVETFKINIEASYWMHDSSSIQKIWPDFEKFVFVDLKSMTYYDYLSFSDTASIKDCYKSSDSMVMGKLGGYRSRFYFLKPLPDTSLKYNQYSMPDTLIDGKVFKRLQFSQKKANEKKQEIIVKTTLYFDCSVNLGPVKIDKEFADKMGCPVVLKDEERSDEASIIYYEYKLVRNKLTKAELRVFKAWEKYAKKHPGR